MTRRRKWTDPQNVFLMENSHKGSEWCAKEISRQFGVKRTPEATKRHGTRIGCSWVRYEICPECGKPIVRMPQRMKMCRECNIKRLRDKARRESEQAQQNGFGENESYDRIKREYNMYRRRKCPRV